MAQKRLGIERPSFEGMNDEQLQFARTLEALVVLGNAQEVKSSFDPRTWPIPVHLAIVTAVISVGAWLWNRGSDWNQVENAIAQQQLRQAAIELRIDTFEKTYARRDLLEQQMNYMLKGLDELKVKVDQLTASSR